MSGSRNWIAPATGIAFVVLLIVSFAIGGEPPDVDEGAAEAVAFYTDDKDKIQAGAGLAGIAAVLLVFFGGYLRKVLRAAEGEGGILSAVAFGGTIIFATGGAIDSTINFAAAEMADDVDPIAVHTLVGLWQNDFFPLAVGMSLIFLASGISIVRHGALPAWLGWVAILIGVVASTPIGFFAFPVAGLWILVVSVMLIMRERSGGTATA